MDDFFGGLGIAIKADAIKGAPFEERMYVASQIGLKTAIPLGIVTGPELNALYDRQAVELGKADEAHTVRVVRATRSTCDCGAMDRVSVTTYSPFGIAACNDSSERHGVPAGEFIRPIAILATDSHNASSALAMLDIADAEKLVNELTEAIAEAREAYG